LHYAGGSSGSTEPKWTPAALIEDDVHFSRQDYQKRHYPTEVIHYLKT
jgi:hypothetical protein